MRISLRLRSAVCRPFYGADELCSLPHIRSRFGDVCSHSVRNETAQRKWQRILAEYAFARAEHQLACQVLLNQPRAGDLRESDSAAFLAEQVARRKLLDLRDQMERLETDSWLDAPGALAD